MGNIYDALIDLGYEDVETEEGDNCSHGNSWHSNCSDCDTEVDLDRDVPDYEDWVLGHIGEPEYLGDR